VAVDAAAGGAGFNVLPDALAGHAGSVTTAGLAVDTAAAAGEQVRLGSQAYGLLCQVIPTLLEPIQQATVAAARDSGSSLRSAADQLRDTAQRYLAAEESVGEQFVQLRGRLDSSAT
jgi:hypothetical protein